MTTKDIALPEDNNSIEQFSCLKLKPVDYDIHLELDRATKISFSEITALGSGFALLPELIKNTVTQNTGLANNLFYATDQFGNPITASLLQMFKDGTGFLGSILTPDGFSQVRFHPAGAATLAANPAVPVILFAAVMLATAGKKLDDIQETQKEMFDYLKRHDKANLRGNLATLSDVFENYRFNWDNTTYKTNKHNQVQLIRQDAEKNVIFYRSEIATELSKKGFINIDAVVNDRLSHVVSQLGEYRLSLYLFAYATFLEVLLLENFEPQYLEAQQKTVREHLFNYKELYTKCYDEIEQSSKTSAESAVVGGLSFLSKAVGSFVANTPIGDVTPIDEALLGASKDLENANNQKTDSLLEKLREIKNTDIQQFIEGIDNLNQLYNQTSSMVIGNDSVFFLPKAEG